MRRYFANIENYLYLIPPQLRTEEKIEIYKNMEIYDIQPQVLRQFPTILMIGSSGNMITTGLGDMALEVYDPQTEELVAYKYGGMYEFNITLEIGCKETFEREFLTDLVTKILRVDLRRKMEAEGILIKNVGYGGESVINYDSNNIYVSSINISTWSEWYEDYDLVSMDDISINKQE